MRYFIFLFSVYLLSCSSISCITNDENIQDKETLPFNSNAIVAIKVKGEKNFCSGVLISPTQVLTATHCIYHMKTQRYASIEHIKVGIGENLFDKSFEWKPISKTGKLPKETFYSTEEFIERDIVQLFLQDPVPITPITLAKEIDNDASFYAWGFGEDQWGYMGIKKSRQLVNAKVEDTVISFTSGACRGDSGGPILDSENRLVAIISLSRVPLCVEEGKRIAQRFSFSSHL